MNLPPESMLPELATGDTSAAAGADALPWHAFTGCTPLREADVGCDIPRTVLIASVTKPVLLALLRGLAEDFRRLAVQVVWAWTSPVQDDDARAILHEAGFSAGALPTDASAATDGQALAARVEAGAAPDWWLGLDAAGYMLSIDTRCTTASQATLLSERLKRFATAFAAGGEGNFDSPLCLQAHDLERLQNWGAGPTPASTARFAHVVAAVHQQAITRPDAPAVVGPDGIVLSYSALWAMAGRVAQHLQQRGVQPGSTVATALGRSAAAIAALLGIWRAGAAYMPLDARHPAARIRAMLSTASASALLHDQAGLAALADLATSTAARTPVDGDLELSLIDSGTLQEPGIPADRALPARSDAQAEAAAVGTPQRAYVMFTSGSTGVPKAIGVSHQAILRLVIDPSFASFGASTRMLQAAPLGFDASTLELWGPLANGGVCVVHSEDRPTPQGLAQTIAIQQVNTAWLTAGLFNTVVDTAVEALAGLQHLLVGGEALSVAHVQRAQRAHPALRLTNGYGPTETTTFATTFAIPPLPAQGAVATGDVEAPGPTPPTIPIGRPINHTYLRLLAPDGLTPVPPGFVGELWIGGAGVAEGYLGQPRLTAERFVMAPLEGPDGTPGHSARPVPWYRTGDHTRWRDDGQLEFCGRLDGQIKMRGFRIELSEIEAALVTSPGVRAAAAVVEPACETRAAQIVAWLVPADVPSGSDIALLPPPGLALRTHLAERLPSYMLPARFEWLPSLPTNANGKVDRPALVAAALKRRAAQQAQPTPESKMEGRLGDQAASSAGSADPVVRLGIVLGSVLGTAALGPDDHFFEHGGDSLAVLRAVAAVQAAGLGRLAETAFYRTPTPRALAADLTPPTPASDPGHPSGRPRPASDTPGLGDDDPIAIIAMAGRFPGAANVDALWALLQEGRDGITHFSDADLDPSLDPSDLQDPAYVKARGLIDGVDQFDAGFFGFTPREASLTDPQHRVFLEIAWECLERAGYAPGSSAALEQTTGVFAGMYNASYWQHHLLPDTERVQALGAFQVMLANEKDYLPTRVAHKLDLTGPAVSVQTACSTSLVAVAQAVAALKAGDCRMALAGGVSITCPPRSGYRHEPGSMLSPDGVTRSFDTAAAGTVFSDGAAVVLLKRLSHAETDGDTVLALVRGIAVNNDGRHKASFTAPSVDGQARVLQAAWKAAGITPDALDHLEAHGTATPLGDPVEVAALRQAWLQVSPQTWRNDAVHTLGLASLKSNIGHTVTAAGAAGVIKTVLALQHDWQPASQHVQSPHPGLRLSEGPVQLLMAGRPWPRSQRVRRGAVSSFGVGGTNAHAVIEEAPLSPSAGVQMLGGIEPGSAVFQTLELSARTPSALQQLATSMADALVVPTPTLSRPTASLADIAHTLRTGRAAFAHRLAVVARTPEAAAAALRSASHLGRVSGTAQGEPRSVWLFPGQGSQTVGMGEDMARDDAVFARAYAEVCACLDSHRLALDPRARPLRELIAAGPADALAATEVTQPATFAIEWALAQSWLARGLTPAALIGHSVGEFAAAAVAGVMSLADAARLVVHRGALMQAQPRGAMLQVRLSADAVLRDLAAAGYAQALTLAAQNAPQACVLAGADAAIDAMMEHWQQTGVACRRLQTSHAFHSPDMEGACSPFEAHVSSVALHEPVIPIVSTCTGTWLTSEEARSPGYWVQQLRQPVRFSQALSVARGALDAVFLEVGPGRALTGLVRQHTPSASAPLTDSPRVVASLPEPPPDCGPSPARGFESEAMAVAAAQHWAWGLSLVVDKAAPAAATLRRVALPTYPFERQRCWVDAPAKALSTQPMPSPSSAHSSAPTASRVVPEATMTTTVLPASDSRRARLADELRALCADVSGNEIPAEAVGRPLIELGLDSLTLTQLALQVKRRYRVPVSFRQLMESTRSVDALAEHLDASLPAPVAAAAEPARLESGSPTAGATPGTTRPELAPAAAPSSLQQVIQQQLALMSQQLALLGSQQMPAATASMAAPVAAAAAAAAAEPATTPQPVRYDVKTAFGAIARIHTQSSQVTQRQQARLEAFVRHYTSRTARSKAYTVQHRKHLADPRVVNGFRPLTKEITYQLVIDRSRGSRVWDLDGNEYVDVLNGFGMNLFGWSPDFVQDAVRRQLDAGYEIGPQHPLAGDVAALVCELTGFDRAGLCNTGSEAVMAAIRIARTVTGRQTVALFTGSYHGTFDEVVVRAGRNGRGIPAAPGILEGAFGDVRVLEYGTAESLAYLREHADDLAAVLVEPVQSRRPDFQPVDYLKALRQLTTDTGSCLIFDEVITGFRAHLGGVQAAFGIRADLATYGKVIGGGFPIGVVAGRREYMDALDGGAWQYGDDSVPSVGVTYFAGTFVRHPLTLAAAHAALSHLKTQGPGLQHSLNERTTAFVARLNAYCRLVGAPIEVRHFASLWRLSWLQEHPLQDLLFAMMRSRGVHILDNFPCFLTTAHTDADLALVQSAFEASVAELQASEFLPSADRASETRVACSELSPALVNSSVPAATTPQAGLPAGARMGRDKDGRVAWFVPDPARAGRFMRLATAASDGIPAELSTSSAGQP